MDKQKQIEEMARTLTTCERNSCVGCGRECIDYRMAKALYNAGYRKIPELPQETVLTVDDIAELLTIVARETRKKTARKFAKVFKTKLFDLGNVVTETDIDEICKEIIGEKV